MASLSPVPKLQFFDANGDPLVGGKLYSYVAGTTTPLATYTDSTGTTQNANPTILDSRGEAGVWMGSSLYKLVLKTSTDIEIWTVDNVNKLPEILSGTGGAANVGFAAYGNITATNVQAAIEEEIDDLAASTGSSLIGYTQGGASSVARTVQSRLRDMVSVFDYGAVGDGTTDDTTAIQAAINAAFAVYFPPTTNGYAVSTASLVIPAGRVLTGASGKTKIVQNVDDWLFDIRGSNVSISGFVIDATATTTAGRGVARIRTDLGSYTDISIRDLQCSQSRYLVTDMNNAAGTITGLTISDIRATTMRGPGVVLADAVDQLRIQNVTVDYNGSAARDFKGFDLTTAVNFSVLNCTVLGAAVDSSTSAQTGYSFTTCSYGNVSGCLAIRMGGSGFYFNGSSFMEVSNSTARLCFAYGIYAENTCTRMLFANCITVGRQGESVTVATQHAFYITACTSVQIVGTRAASGTGAGFYLNNTTEYNLAGCRADNNATYGLQTNGTTSGVSVGVGFKSNTTNNVSLATSNDHAANCQKSAGTLFTLTGPGTG